MCFFDKKMWNKEDKEAQKALHYCGPHCWGGVECTADCMIEKENFTKKCAECFGKFSGCIAANCVSKCWPDSLTACCINCVKDHCVKSFMKCSSPPGWKDKVKDI